MGTLVVLLLMYIAWTVHRIYKKLNNNKSGFISNIIKAMQNNNDKPVTENSSD